MTCQKAWNIMHILKFDLALLKFMKVAMVIWLWVWSFHRPFLNQSSWFWMNLTDLIESQWLTGEDYLSICLSISYQKLFTWNVTYESYRALLWHFCFLSDAWKHQSPFIQNIIQNVLFCDSMKNESHTGLKQQEGK